MIYKKMSTMPYCQKIRETILNRAKKNYHDGKQIIREKVKNEHSAAEFSKEIKI